MITLTASHNADNSTITLVTTTSQVLPLYKWHVAA